MGIGEARRLEALGDIEIIEEINPTAGEQLESRVLRPMANAAKRVGRAVGVAR